jgi:hypothetical protein
MNKQINYDFVKCHVCNYENDVSKQVYIFNNDFTKDVITHKCIKCSSSMSLIISMMYGLTTIERQGLKNKKLTIKL